MTSPVGEAENWWWGGGISGGGENVSVGVPVSQSWMRQYGNRGCVSMVIVDVPIWVVRLCLFGNRRDAGFWGEMMEDVLMGKRQAGGCCQVELSIRTLQPFYPPPFV